MLKSIPVSKPISFIRPYCCLQLVVRILLLIVPSREIYHAITAYRYLVTHHNDPAVLGTLVQTLIIEIVFSNLIAIFVQMYILPRFLA